MAWAAGALTGVAAVVTAALRLPTLVGDHEYTAVWSWVERASWLAGVAGLLVATVALRHTARPATRPSSAPAVPPASRPQIRHVAPRNRGFTGREELLSRRPTPSVHAFHGWGGVGKTQLALEYTYRHADDYDLVWWFAAERTELLGEQYAQLAAAVGIAGPGTDAEIAFLLVRRWLRENPRWLLVFDDAQEPSSLRRWIPDGPGDVLITSRRGDWQELATPIAVDVFSREESVALLGERGGLGGADARGLAHELGDLPLALAQAAGFMSETGMPPGEFLATLAHQADRLLAEGVPASYPLSLAAMVTITAEQAGAADPAAAQLLRLVALCAPEPVPLWLFAGAPPGILPSPLAPVCTEPLRLRQIIGLLTRLGLARADSDSVQLHRLTRAILQASMPPARAAEDRGRVERLLVAAQPAETDDPADWPTWATLAPHLLALDLAGSVNGEVRALAANWLRSVLKRGSVPEGLSYAERFHREWGEIHGPDDVNVLQAAFLLGHAYFLAGRADEARVLDEDTYARRARVLGDDQHDTLDSANNLAAALARCGRLAEARALYEDVLARRRRLLGDDHADTIRSAGNLATAMRKAGEHEAAEALHTDTWNRRRRVSGVNHPDTLHAAYNVAVDLRHLGELAAARRLLEETYRALQAAVGPDHPETQLCAHELGTVLMMSGATRDAEAVLAEAVRRRRRIFGDDHPDTRASERSLAAVRVRSP